MNKYRLVGLNCCLLILFVQGPAQKDNFLKEYLERWENSKKYLLLVAEAMPESEYGFKPSAEEMSFGTQLVHIAAGIDWHAQMLIGGRKEEVFPLEDRKKKIKADNRTKKEIIEIVSKTFDEATELIKMFDLVHYEDTLTYISYTRTKRQIFLLLSDHITHHRA